MLARTSHKTLLLCCLTVIVFVLQVSPAQAQLNDVMHLVFEEILVKRVQRTSGPLGNHSGNHFLTSADVTNSKLAPALNSFITNNVTSFPIPTMVPSMSFHMSAGVPVIQTDGLGPIFAEPAETVGKGVFNVGMSFSHLNLNKIRGIRTGDLQFAFTHRDLTGDGTLGDVPPESDMFVVDVNMDLAVSISALVATYGLTNALDVGVAVPLIATQMQGEADATIISYTLEHFGIAVHRFGGSDIQPVLKTTVPFDESALGLGDVALRVKYHFLRGSNMNSSALLEMRLPTGKQDDYMGTGKTSFRLAFMSEQRFGNFSPHLNLGFDRKTVGLNNDKLGFRAGFEQRLREGFSLAFDVIGAYDLNNSTTISFPSSTIIYDHLDGTVTERAIELSNIPNRDNDNLLDASLGFRFAPSERFAVLANVLLPLNDGGLRSSFVPTVGFSMNL